MSVTRSQLIDGFRRAARRAADGTSVATTPWHGPGAVERLGALYTAAGGVAAATPIAGPEGVTYWATGYSWTGGPDVTRPEGE